MLLRLERRLLRFIRHRNNLSELTAYVTVELIWYGCRLSSVRLL